MFKKSGKAVSALLAVGIVGAMAGSWTGPAAAGQVCYFGECRASATPAPAPQSKATQVSKRGSWSSVLVGEGAMIIDEFQNGSRFAILVYPSGQFGLMLMHPEWQLEKGQEVEMTIRIDGEGYKGKAVATERNVLTVDGVSKDLLKTLYRGRQGRIEVPNYSFDMTNLADAAAVINDTMARLKTSASR